MVLAIPDEGMPIPEKNERGHLLVKFEVQNATLSADQVLVCSYMQISKIDYS